MAHIHPVYDTDSHFTINPITREIKNESSTKTRLIQYDHSSERFSFDMPKTVEGHDMTLCNVVQVHYINIDSQTKESKTGMYEVDDVQVHPEKDDTICFSWLISKGATQLVGSLNFLIRFSCVSDGVELYAWNTELHSGLSVSTGLYAGDIIANDYVDILEQWRENLLNATPKVNVETTSEGAKITVTDSEGSTETVIKNGKTPVKGVDYFTNADEQNIVSQVLNSLPTYNGEVE